MLSGFGKFWHKVTHWEYWPFGVLYFPVYFYYTWLSIRCRSFFFFTAANPFIEFGGMLGESKSAIFDLIPYQFIPAYQRIFIGEVESALLFAKEIGYPLVCKPDIGERGNLVEVIQNEHQLKKYVEHCPVDFLIQQFVSYPIELGVFYTKKPGETKGKISSIVQKDFLHVIGDGIHSVKELLEKNNRALLQLDFSDPRFASILSLIPSNGEKVIVEPIGNHCRGTMFLDMTNSITPALESAFDTLCSQIDGFHFGRFDLRCKSFSDLERLENFKILELNGAGAEPGHIYQPGYPLLKGYQSILWHLKQLSLISRENHKRGVKYWTFKRGIAKMRAIKAYNQTAQRR